MLDFKFKKFVSFSIHPYLKGKVSWPENLYFDFLRKMRFQLLGKFGRENQNLMKIGGNFPTQKC